MMARRGKRPAGGLRRSGRSDGCRGPFDAAWPIPGGVLILRLLVLALSLALLGWGLRWLLTASPRAVARGLRAVGLAGLVGLGLWLLVTGRLAGLIAVAAGLAPWVTRLLHLHALWRRLRPKDGPAARLAGDPAMTVAEAWEVLGLAPGASDAEIRAAHRRLMRTNHPDHGGSGWIAARLNQARDLLLAGRQPPS